MDITNQNSTWQRDVDSQLKRVQPYCGYFGEVSYAVAGSHSTTFGLNHAHSASQVYIGDIPFGFFTSNNFQRRNTYNNPAEIFSFVKIDEWIFTSTFRTSPRYIVWDTSGGKDGDVYGFDGNDEFYVIEGALIYDKENKVLLRIGGFMYNTSFNGIGTSNIISLGCIYNNTERISTHPGCLTNTPTLIPTDNPTIISENPSISPTLEPTHSPTQEPTYTPTAFPTVPTMIKLINISTAFPSIIPNNTTYSPTIIRTSSPTNITLMPSDSPTINNMDGDANINNSDKQKTITILSILLSVFFVVICIVVLSLYFVFKRNRSLIQSKTFDSSDNANNTPHSITQLNNGEQTSEQNNIYNDEGVPNNMDINNETITSKHENMDFEIKYFDNEYGNEPQNMDFEIKYQHRNMDFDNEYGNKQLSTPEMTTPTKT